MRTKRYIALYDRFGVEGYSEHDTISDAEFHLKYGSEEGILFDIAIIDMDEGLMVWFNDFLGYVESEFRVKRFLESGRYN